MISPPWPGPWVLAGSPSWAIPWAAWSPSWCTGGMPRWCQAWCCAPPRAVPWGHRWRSWPPRRCRLPPPPCGWNPVLQLISAEALGLALLGPIDDPATARWARAQLRRTTLASAVSAIQAVCAYTAMSWLGQVDVPAAVVVTTRDRIVLASRQLELARAIPRSSVHQVDADHGVCLTAPRVYAPALLNACWSVQPGRGRDNRRPGHPRLQCVQQRSPHLR